MKIKIFEIHEKLPRVVATNAEVAKMPIDKIARVFLMQEDGDGRITLDIPLDQLPKGAILGDEYAIRFSVEPINRIY